MKTSEVEALAVLAEMSSFLEGKPLAAALRTLSAERDALAAENARLRETGGKLLELWAKPSESNFEAFERIAHAFYRETGVMAPGKDAPAGSSQGEPEERRAKYNLWMERRVASFRDALTKESDQ